MTVSSGVEGATTVTLRPPPAIAEGRPASRLAQCGLIVTGRFLAPPPAHGTVQELSITTSCAKQTHAR